MPKAYYRLFCRVCLDGASYPRTLRPYWPLCERSLCNNRFLSLTQSHCPRQWSICNSSSSTRPRGLPSEANAIPSSPSRRQCSQCQARTSARALGQWAISKIDPRNRCSRWDKLSKWIRLCHCLNKELRWQTTQQPIL